MGNDEALAMLSEEVRYLRGHLEEVVNRIEEKGRAQAEQEERRYLDLLKAVHNLDKKVLVITVIMLLSLGDRVFSLLLHLLTGG